MRSPARTSARVLAGVAIALAMAAPVVLSSRATARAAARGAAAGEVADGVRRKPLVFDDLRWGRSRTDAARRLARRGWRRAPDRDRFAGGEAWSGTWRGEPATCTPEFGAQAGLIAVTLRFEPGSGGDALRLYAALGAEMERRHGPELVDVGPQRSTERVHDGLRWRLARVGEPAGARLWTGDDGAAAALQLDGGRIVWLRWEAPGWKAEVAPDAPPDLPRR